MPTESDSRTRLIEQHMSFAEALAREISKQLPRWVAFDDLRQSAFLGLADAAQRFDMNARAAFTTFAHPRVRGAVWDAVRKMRDIPPALRREAKRQALFALATDDLGASIEASANDPAAVATQLRKAIRLAGAVVLLGDLEADQHAGSPIASPSAEPVESNSERDEVLDALRRAIRELDQKHRAVVEAIVYQGRTQTDLARERGCDKSVICRLWKEAIEVLQTPMRRAVGAA